jgi:DNA-binding transcriptional LysR family regulator
MDRLAMMEAFVRVAETHSFSEAARRMRTSKSLVSRQVAALETELGARLLNRTTRALTLTEVGHGYFQRASQILAEVADANLSVSQLQAAPRGRLRVDAPISFGVLHLIPAISGFLCRCPDVDIELSLNDRYIDLIDEGVDLAIRIGRLADSSLVARKLATARRILCASPAYLAAFGTPATPSDLKGHRCLGYTNIASTREWLFHDRDGRPWPVDVEGRLRVNNGDALRAAALRGIGIVSLPSFIVGGDLQTGTLVSLLADYIPQDFAIHAVYPHSRHLSPKVRAFVDFLVEQIGPHPYWDLVE